MKKSYFKPQTNIYKTNVEQPIMGLSTVKFHEVENGGENKDENGVMPSDDPDNSDWNEIGWN